MLSTRRITKGTKISSENMEGPNPEKLSAANLDPSLTNISIKRGVASGLLRFPFCKRVSDAQS
jgi:hypothetical protein